MKLKLAALVVAATMSSSVLADSYFGVNYVDAKVDFGFADASPSAVMMKYGSYMGENFSLEGRLAFGLSDDTTFGVDIEVDQMLGLYGVYNFQPDGDFNPYVMIGYTDGEISADGVSGSESDFSFGLGADIAVGETSAINLEYATFLDKDGVEISGISAGFTWNF
ncbi:porin family protein [Aliikangiella marina]|uniref:Porin family protein n=1 Tax=Aliikangiella marina TaxID=1712262 RepID=A0A545T8X3_9GAMM|nr:porin family protein [Aliikangiella marina]TQV73661.1 porin family protein [Aliikangiella marina]